MAKRPTARSEARDTATISNRPVTPRPAASSTAIDIPRDRGGEPLDSGIASSNASARVEPSEEDIRRRAYQRYLERGGRHGQDFDDWLEAEKELRQK